MVVVVGQPQVGASVLLTCFWTYGWHAYCTQSGCARSSGAALTHQYITFTCTFDCFAYQDGIGLVTGVTWSLGYKPCFVILKILTVIKRG